MTGYRSIEQISKDAMPVLAAKAVREHPGWDDDRVVRDLALAYSGYRPEELAAVLHAAVAEARRH